MPPVPTCRTVARAQRAPHHSNDSAAVPDGCRRRHVGVPTPWLRHTEMLHVRYGGGLAMMGCWIRHLSLFSASLSCSTFFVLLPLLLVMRPLMLPVVTAFVVVLLVFSSSSSLYFSLRRLAPPSRRYRRGCTCATRQLTTATTRLPTWQRASFSTTVGDASPQPRSRTARVRDLTAFHAAAVAL
jgi:hypothetical protein